MLSASLNVGGGQDTKKKTTLYLTPGRFERTSQQEEFRNGAITTQPPLPFFSIGSIAHKVSTSGTRGAKEEKKGITICGHHVIAWGEGLSRGSSRTRTDRQKGQIRRMIGPQQRSYKQFAFLLFHLHCPFSHSNKLTRLYAPG